MAENQQKLSLSDLSPEDRKALLEELKSQEEHSKTSDSMLGLKNVLADIASDSGRAKYDDPQEFFRKPDNTWTFYLRNNTDTDVLITDLGGPHDKNETVRVKIIANAGIDLLTVTQVAEHIKGSTQLSKYLRPGGELTRLTPEEWDEKYEVYDRIVFHRSNRKDRRNAKRQDAMRQSPDAYRRELREQEAYRRMTAPKRAKVSALVDRIRNSHIEEEEILSWIDQLEPKMTEFEHRVLLESINELTFPEAGKRIREIKPIPVDPAEIEKKIEEYHAKRKKLAGAYR